MRKPIIAGNWKMHKTVDESIDLVNNLKVSLGNVSPQDIGVVVAPVYTSLYPVYEVIRDHWIKLSDR